MSEKLVITREEYQKTWSYWLNSFFYPSEEDGVEEKFKEKNHGDLGDLDFRNCGYYENADENEVKVFISSFDFEFEKDEENYISMDFYKM